MTYVELHAHSAYSFLDGASQPEELAARAAELGYEALALTDHDGVYGSLEFAHAAKHFGVRPITGAEVTLADESHVTLLVESARGYANLCRLLTAAHAHTRDTTNREPLPPRLDQALLEELNEGLVCLSGCARDGLAVRDPNAAARLARAFGRDRFYVELQRPYERGDERRNAHLRDLAASLGVRTVATGDVHAHDRRRAALQDVLVAVRCRTSLEGCEQERRGNHESVLLSPEEMRERFVDDRDAVHRTTELAERLEFDLTEELGYRYPDFSDGEEPAIVQLRRVCESAFAERYNDLNGHKRRVRRRLEEELALIDELGLAGFFLLHWEVLELAREVALEVRGPGSMRHVLPPGRGRGSSVGSLVCYLTGLSHVDPVANNLSLGRFLNRELASVPDIDLDFPRDIREKLIVRVVERYGSEHASLVAAFATYRSRGAIRDVGKALGLPYADLERLARLTDGWNAQRVADEIAALPDAATKLRSPRWRAFGALCSEIAGLPRHISQHPGGMVISSRPLVELVPVQPAAMEGRQMCQWDKDSCADAGFLKIDLLGLGMLSAVEECVDLIARHRGERIDLSRVRLDDPDVFAEIQQADTVGCFQIESRAQMQVILRTRPETIDDITVQVALVRPGPIQGKAVHPYVERRQLLRDDPAYRAPADHPLLEEPLRETLGVVVFQDQVLDVAVHLAGFSVGEAEGLRRAMSRKRSHAALEAWRERFVAGALEKGVEETKAHELYDKLVAFSGFGFPKSHAAAFGLLAYQSAWLRHHYAPEFLAALLNAQPMGFYPPATLVRDGQKHGVETRPPDVNRSDAGCTIEDDGAVRVGLKYVTGVGEDDAEAVAAKRPYSSIRELAQRDGAVGGRAARARRVGRLRLFRPAPSRAPLAARARAAAGERARHGRRGEAARAAARADGRHAGAARADGVGADAHRLPDDEPLRRRPSARAAAVSSAAGNTVERRVARAAGPGEGAIRGARRRAPAAVDRERRRLHAPRGRARAGEPRRPAAGLRAVPRGRAQRAAPARPRPVRALGPQPERPRGRARLARAARPLAHRRRRRPRRPPARPPLRASVAEEIRLRVANV